MLLVPAWKQLQNAPGMWEPWGRRSSAGWQNSFSEAFLTHWGILTGFQCHTPLRAWGNMEQRRRKCGKPELIYCHTAVSGEKKTINLYFAPLPFGFPDCVLCSYTTTAAAPCFSQWQIKRQVVNKTDFNFNLMKCNLIQ